MSEDGSKVQFCFTFQGTLLFINNLTHTCLKSFQHFQPQRFFFWVVACFLHLLPFPLLLTCRGEPAFLDMMHSWQCHESLMASDLLTRPKHSSCTFPVQWILWQWRRVSIGWNVCFKRRAAERQIDLFIILFYIFSVTVFCFCPPQKFRVWPSLHGRWEVGGLVAVWQGGTRRWKYVRNVSSSRLLLGRLYRKSADVSPLTTLQKTALRSSSQKNKPLFFY